mmetsp:Transcript_7750/g.23444  ORF Transcript_7750/g.23444 Transcript_7750/m.23444 type:complete len:295 (-) Transcript_7750:281-1165(-)
MAMRSRTALFVRFREDARRLGPSPARRSAGSASADFLELELDELGQKPEFIALHEQLGKQLKIADGRIARLADLHAKRLLPGFAEDTIEEQESEIKFETEAITREIHACEVAIRNIPGNTNRLWANMQKTFAAQLQDISIRFRAQQKHYLKNLENQRDMINSVLVKKNESHLVMLDDDSDDGGRNGFTQDQLLEIQNADIHLEERNREIDRIAASIQDLASIMKDMGQLVIEQGTILDRIDYNVEESQFKTQDATEQLRQAERYQRKGISFAIIMCLLIGCFIMAVLLIVKLLG